MSIATHVNKDNPRDHTVVLVHGGWQTPDVFTALVKYLERAGYSVLAPALPSVGTIPAVPNFDEDVKAVRDAVKSLVDTGKKVIIVMHSYGAVPGCEALKDFVQEVGKDDYEDVDLQGGVVRLLFLAGMVLAPGMSTWSPNRTGPVPGFTEQNNLVTLHDGATRFYQDLGAEDAAYWASKLQVHSMLAFYSKLTFPAYKHFPSTYVYTLQDNAIPLKIQQRMCSVAGITSSYTVDTGHAPHISHPRLVGLFIRRCCGEHIEHL